MSITTFLENIYPKNIFPRFPQFFRAFHNFLKKNVKFHLPK